MFQKSCPFLNSDLSTLWKLTRLLGHCEPKISKKVILQLTLVQKVVLWYYRGDCTDPGAGLNQIKSYNRDKGSMRFCSSTIKQ